MIMNAMLKLADITHKLQKVSIVKTKKYLSGEILDIEESSKG